MVSQEIHEVERKVISILKILSDSPVKNHAMSGVIDCRKLGSLQDLQNTRKQAIYSN